MNGKIIAIGLVLFAAIFGGALWYFQTRAYYAPIDPGSAAAAIVLTRFDGAAEPLQTDGFEGVDADTSPLRFRDCFTTPMSLATLTETAQPYERATPLVAPGWFGCFDAEAIGAALDAGTALAFLGRSNTPYGIDRVVAVADDGRGWSWPQINACGTAAFAGDPVPDGCPPPPERD